jgi:hypothetical protein
MKGAYHKEEALIELGSQGQFSMLARLLSGCVNLNDH